MSTRVRRAGAERTRRIADPEVVRPATRAETLPVGMFALVSGFIALSVCALRGTMLLYGDAVAHLGIARRIIDTTSPGLVQLGGVWLPLPHLLMLPFIGRMEWWQNGMAGAWPSLACYVISVMGIYRLARRLIEPRWALVATAFFGLNANLLYLSTTAMTEPLFLALLVWIVLGTLECVDAMRTGRTDVAQNRMVLLGMLIFAAVMTRYDGWILGAAVWCVVAWNYWRQRASQGRLLAGFVTFTLLTVAGPVCWLEYNHVYGRDWLDFMRGPYSAKEIDRRTSPPGSKHYFGWHDPAWSLMLYLRTAQVDAATWETGFLLLIASVWGAITVWRERVHRTILLLWLPLPFYVYSVSYGSVPIFIPQIYPHSFYNSRYGMEMLPAFAIFLGAALAWGSHRLVARQPLVERLMQPVALLLVMLNTVWMAHAVPLVLQEAYKNSTGRIAIEQAMAREMQTFRPGAKILMDNSAHVGALQTAGIPLRQTIGPDDYYGWLSGMAAPAGAAEYVIGVAGDPVSKAVEAHPAGLTELTIVCTSGEPCVRLYRSDRYGVR